ncbi:MAG: carbohydrate-binding domain-containing protein, partial [Coriobacteriales bacterium]
MEAISKRFGSHKLRVVAALTAATAAALAVGCVCATPAHAYVSSIQTGSTYIYNTSGSAQSVPGITYDDATKTLTLTNVNISETSNSGIIIATNDNDTVTVQLNGSNSVIGGSSYHYGIECSGSLVFQGSGSLYVKGHTGISANDTITVNSGTINAYDSDYFGICGNDGVTLNGGTVSAGGRYYSINSSLGRISNNYRHLGKIRGRMGVGATFVSSGNKYQVGPSEGDVILVKAKKKLKSMTVQSKRFSGYTYLVRGIAAKAFAGCKVKKVTIGGNVRTIGKRAFYKTTKLKTLNMRKCNLISLYNRKVSGISKK